MAEGEKAAEQTKSAFQQAGQATEGLRQNINSYADQLLSGNKSHDQTSTHSDAKNYSSTHSSTTTEPEVHPSTGIHPDAKATGEGLTHGAGKVAGHIENYAEKHSHGNKAGGTGPIGKTPGEPRPGEVRPGETASSDQPALGSRLGGGLGAEDERAEDGAVPVGVTYRGGALGLSETRPPGTEDRT